MYQLSIDVSGESIDEMLLGLETVMAHQLAPLAENDDLRRELEHEGSYSLGVTGDRADVTGELAWDNDDPADPDTPIHLIKAAV